MEIYLKKGDKEPKLSSPDSRKDEINVELKNEENNDREDMVFRMGLTYLEIENILDMKYIEASRTGYTWPLGIYEIIDNNSMLKCLLYDEVKVNITIDVIRQRSNSTSNETKRFTKNFFSINY